MADSLIRGWLEAQVVPAKQVSVLNRSNQKRIEHLMETYGVLPANQKEEAVSNCDILILAIKPHDILQFLQSIKGFLTERQLIISLAAGISTRQIEEAVGIDLAVVRAMPNTAAAVLESATALSYGRFCTPRAQEIASVLLGTVGTLSVVEESLMDAVTGLSGSGPAYFYYIVEAMQAAGKSLGLPEQVANQLVEQTLVGAAKMLHQGELPAAELRQRVTSPNGTTFAGIGVLEQGNFTDLMILAVAEAKKRATEMGQEVYLSARSH